MHNQSLKRDVAILPPRPLAFAMGGTIMNNPTISIVIPAYNEERYIGKTLDSILTAKKNYQDPKSIEIIVVNNCSTDKTEEIAKSKGVLVVNEEKRCIASVRNKGAIHSNGSVIGFLDADCSVSPNIFASIAHAMSSGKYIGGGTKVKIERKSIGIYMTYLLTTIPAKWFFGVAGGLIFTERKTFDEIGGFDETLYCAEDSALILKLKDYGKKQGKKFKIITEDYVITSSRSFDRFGDWYYFKNLPSILLRGGTKAFRDRDFCWKFWYDPNR